MTGYTLEEIQAEIAAARKEHNEMAKRIAGKVGILSYPEALCAELGIDHAGHLEVKCRNCGHHPQDHGGCGDPCDTACTILSCDCKELE